MRERIERGRIERGRIEEGNRGGQRINSVSIGGTIWREMFLRMRDRSGEWELEKKMWLFDGMGKVTMMVVAKKWFKD